MYHNLNLDLRLGKSKTILTKTNNNMKKNYLSPTLEIIEMELEESLLLQTSLETNSTLDIIYGQEAW